MKFIRAFILAFLLLPLRATASDTLEDSAGREAASHLRISLLTCSKGGDISSAFGHSALRVTDSVSGRDMVFNYGTFDFYDPGFLLKFLHGDLYYFLSVGKFSSFVNSYEKEGRSIVEREMNLSQGQRKEIYRFLLENYKPENREYLYDFLTDNCATRVRDIFDGEEYLYIPEETSLTYRDELEICVGSHSWLMLGIDLLLGARVDRKISTYEEMFLPDRLSEQLLRYRNNITSGDLLGSEVTILPAGPSMNKWEERISAVTAPMMLFVLLFLGLTVLFLKVKRRERLLYVSTMVYYALLGAGGVILTYMWFGTNHVWTADNWNLLWCNPLSLVVAFWPKGRVRDLGVTVMAALSAVTLVLSPVIPQDFNRAVPVIIMIQVLMGMITLIKIIKKKI